METVPAISRSNAPVERLRFSALGTPCEVQFVAPDQKAGRAFSAAAVNWVTAFEAKYTRFRPDSLVGRINAAAGRDWVAVDADAEAMFTLADQVHILTRGILDATSLPLLRLWDYRAEKPRLPSPPEIAAALQKVGWTKVRREPGRVMLPIEGMGLDLGGFGKEHAVDRVAEIALAHGIKNVLVDFGHDVRAIGSPPDAPCWLVGVENPNQPGTIRGRLAITGNGIATSGDYIRFVEIEGRHFGHIIDPRSGYPVSNGCRSVTVVAGSCLEAGLLSTTAFVLGGEAGIKLIEEFPGAEGCIACADRELQTKGYYRHVV